MTLGRVPSGELADRRRLAGSVDADDQDDRRAASDRWPGLPPGLARDEQGRKLRTDGRLGATRVPSPPCSLDDVHGERRPDVPGDQGLLDVVPRRSAAILRSKEPAEPRHEAATRPLQAVIQALHWYSDAWLQPSLDNELLGLITALETVFTRPERRVTTPLAEGVAFVLANNLTDRKALVARVRHFYRLRGKVAHGGKQPILPADVNELRYYVQNVISVMITNLPGWTSLKSLHDWLEDQRLS